MTDLSINKQLVEQFYSHLWNQHDGTHLQQILHERLIFRGSLGEEHKGIKGFSEYVNKVHTALGNYHCRIDELVCEADKAFAKMYFSGIHKNTFMGYAATLKEVGWSGCALFTFKQQKIISVWVLGDLKSLENQLS